MLTVQGQVGRWRLKITLERVTFYTKCNPRINIGFCFSNLNNSFKIFQKSFLQYTFDKLFDKLLRLKFTQFF